MIQMDYFSHKRLQWLIVLVLLSCFEVASAQKHTAGIREELDRMFAHLERSSVPTGLLRDYAIEYEDLDDFSGQSTLSEKNLLTPLRYGDFLSTIQSSCVNEREAERLSKRFKDLLKCTNDLTKETALSLALYKYDRIRKDALTRNLIKYENGCVYNIKGKKPYQEEIVFASCVLGDGIVHSRQVELKLSKDLVFSNCDIEKVELSYNGNLYPIFYGSKTTLNLSKGNNKIITIVKTTNGRIYKSHFCIYVSDQKKPQMRSLALKPQRYADSYFRVTGTEYRGVRTSAEVSIKYASGNKALKRPLIIVEGFDPRIPSNPKGFCYYEDIDKRLLTFAEQNGFDIVYVDWMQPEEYIQANAQTLQMVIERINQQKVDTKYGNVILAHSMGGLISRYTLKNMENKGVKHQVEKYISYDVPHLGAHIPIGVLYGFYGIQKFIESRGLAGEMAVSFGGYSNMLEFGKKLAYSTSAQQMLINYVDPAGNFNNQEHIAWQKELEQLGFPNGDIGRPIQLLAVANGSYNEFTVPKLYLHTSFEAGSSMLPFFHLMFGIRGVAIVSLALNDIVSGLLTILPGRSSIQGHCSFYSSVKPGELVTDIELTYKNKFLWILPIMRTLFSYSRHSPVALSFEKFPGSTYALPRDNQSRPIDMSGSAGSGPIYDYKYDIKVSDEISFIPTSSALAIGSGVNVEQSQFYAAPQGDLSPFGENYYVHQTSAGHMSFTTEGIDWVFSQLKNSIFGPELGYTGARYTLGASNQQTISWRSSNPAVATIDQNGVLSVRGEGKTIITARCNNMSYSKQIIVGLPKCVLQPIHTPGGFKVTAKGIRKEYDESLSRLSGYLKYKWGIKKPQSAIVWRETTSPQLNLQTVSDDEQIVVFLEVSDVYGNKLPIVHSKIQNRSVYYTEYSHLFFSSSGELFEENMEPYTFEIAYINIVEKDNLPAQYMSSEWIPFTAMVLSPTGRRYEVELENNEIAVRDILNKEERAWIHSMGVDSQDIVYLLELQNSDKKLIQYLPIRFTYIK